MINSSSHFCNDGNDDYNYLSLRLHCYFGAHLVKKTALDAQKYVKHINDDKLKGDSKYWGSLQPFRAAVVECLHSFSQSSNVVTHKQ